MHACDLNSCTDLHCSSRILTLAAACSCALTSSTNAFNGVGRHHAPLLPRSNPHSAPGTTACHFPRFRSLEAFGRRPPASVFAAPSVIGRHPKPFPRAALETACSPRASALSCARAVAAQRIGEECQLQTKGLWCCRHSILGPCKGHELHEDNGPHTRLARCDLFDNGELLWRMGRPQRHDEPATHFELPNQRRRDMPKCGSHDDCVERTAFRPSVITVADLDTHIVIAEVSQHLRSGFGQWRDKGSRCQFRRGESNAMMNATTISSIPPAPNIARARQDVHNSFDRRDLTRASS